MIRPFAVSLLVMSCAHDPLISGAPEPTVTFLRDGDVVATLSRSALTQLTPTQTFTAFDPYYGKPKRWRALELRALLSQVFRDTQLDQREFVLRATDGYTVPLSGARLLEPGGYLAIADDEGPWETIGPTHANPAPFYVVWREPAQQDLSTHPRPWALASISIEPFERVFPKVAPPAGSDAQVLRGFTLWREQCFKCHALNQQGGRVGPELNVPMNITEYRDEAYLRAWIRAPQKYRPSVMPSFAALPDSDLDAVLAYLRAMKSAKDPQLLEGASH